MAFNDFSLGSYYGGINQVQLNAPLSPVTNGWNNQMMLVNSQIDSESENPVRKTQDAVDVGNAGSPAFSWVVLAVAIVALMLIVEKSGVGKNIGDIGLSVYNILVITFIGLLSSGLLKVVFTRFPIPGISSLVVAS